jgi:hypothetical protein
MKKFAILGAILATVVAMLAVTVTPAMAARDPLPPAPKAKILTVVALSWDESYTCYHPDGSYWHGPWSYTVEDVDFAHLVNTYYTTDMAAFMGGGTPPTDLTGFIRINGAGKLFGYASYISGNSGLPIFQLFRGEVEVTLADDGTGTMDGTYADWLYVFGTEDEVVSAYGEGAVPVAPMGHIKAGKAGWWYLAHGEYTVTAVSP